MTEPIKPLETQEHQQLEAYKLGAVVSRMDAAEQRLSRHDVQIAALEQGDASMIAKLGQNDDRWLKVEAQLRVVDQIQDIRNVMMMIGKMVSTFAKVAKWVVVMVALLSGIYVSIHTGDMGSLLQFIQTLIGFNG